jgi:hypothetical protein
MNFRYTLRFYICLDMNFRTYWHKLLFVFNVVKPNYGFILWHIIGPLFNRLWLTKLYELDLD